MILPKEKLHDVIYLFMPLRPNKVHGSELELAEVGHFYRTRKIKFLELGLANIFLTRTRLKVDRVCRPG